jgi:hypothetical protein
MEAWTALRKGICFPILSDRLALDTKMGEMVNSVSNTFESLSIRDYLFDVGSCSATDIMTGSMVAKKNTCE